MGGLVAVPAPQDGGQGEVQAELLAQLATGRLRGCLPGVDDAAGEAVVGAGVDVLGVGAAVDQDATVGVAQQDAVAACGRLRARTSLRGAVPVTRPAASEGS